MTSEKCNRCHECCPMADMAHEAAKGRMYATNEFIALQKKVESGQLVEVVRCRDCKHSWEDISGRVCSYGLLVDCNVPDDFGCVNGERNGGETNGS